MFKSSNIIARRKKGVGGLAHKIKNFTNQPIQYLYVIKYMKPFFILNSEC